MTVSIPHRLSQLFEGEAVVGVPAEEGAVDGLEDVFGVELAADQVVEPAAGQADKAAGETAKHLRGRVVVAGPEAHHQVVEGTVGRRHGRPLPGLRRAIGLSRGRAGGKRRMAGVSRLV